MTPSKEAFEQWRWRLGFLDQAIAVITQIRTSPPARHVQSAAGNVNGTYPSIKMGCSIQFESHRDELPFVYLMDHNPQVLEFYDQPYGQIKLQYRNSTDTRNVTTKSTPDFFVLREDGAEWVECKMEEDLLRLAKKMPHRYQQRLDGSWFCPPGEAYAAQFGLTFRVVSSKEIDWIYVQNLRFLGDYLRGSPPPFLCIPPSPIYPSAFGRSTNRPGWKDMDDFQPWSDLCYSWRKQGAPCDRRRGNQRLAMAGRSTQGS